MPKIPSSPPLVNSTLRSVSLDTKYTTNQHQMQEAGYNPKMMFEITTRPDKENAKREEGIFTAYMPIFVGQFFKLPEDGRFKPPMVPIGPLSGPEGSGTPKTHAEMVLKTWGLSEQDLQKLYTKAIEDLNLRRFGNDELGKEISLTA